jgi:hypothetical protein
MIICLDVSQRTKDNLQKLLESGGCRDYSEVVAIAIENQLLLQNHASGNSRGLDTIGITLQGERLEERTAGVRSSERVSGPLQVPLLFSHLGPATKPSTLAPYPSDSFELGQEVPVDRWIFGQHNKLLPLKATCRALARLMASEIQGNLGLSKTASEIASEAVKLGDYLRRMDETSGAHRDDALSFAFPYSKSPNGDKSRLRYANQFVACFTTQGALTGLPIELKLANRDHSRTPQILLTEAGWLFAEARNPVLDDGKNGRHSKLSDEEIEFLLQHIRTRVPAEAFAYNTVLKAIGQGANTPEKLDDALEEYLPKRDTKPFTRAFLTTQRAGVLSRMIDLGLVRRVRDGITVSYTTTATDLGSLPNPKQAV